MSSTDLVERRTLDLSHAPDEQWNTEMVQMISSSLFRGRQVTKGELYFCLAVADGLALNPLIGEIYFIPSKSRDAKGPSLQPYIGRNGLVKKARERGTYYESDTVHANDKFRIVRKADGTRTVTHSYGSADRGEIVGAYAFLHDDDGRRKPAFFYAKLEEYIPTFDADWKMDASPWGNQRSAMIEKCAMIGAGRKRLDLGNVLMDGELASYEQQGAAARPVAVEAQAFDWEQLSGSEETIARLRAAVELVNERAPMSWPPAKLEMAAVGRTDDELNVLAFEIENEAELAAERAQQDAPEASSASAGDSVEEPDVAGEAVTDALVVSDEEHAAALRAQCAQLEERMGEADPGSEEFSALSAELDGVQAELDALEDPGQGSLLDGSGD